MKPWLKYSIIRVGLFAVLFAILYPLIKSTGVMTPVNSGVTATVIAAIVALCVSYLAFGKLREQVALQIVEARKRPASGSGDDESAEDSVEDAEVLEGDGRGESKPVQ